MRLRSGFLSRSLRLLSAVSLVALWALPSAAGVPCADIEELFIDSLHIYFNADLGYAMELGLEYDSGTGTINSVQVTTPVGLGGRAPFMLSSEGGGEFEEFDGDTIDPDELTGTGYDESTLQSRYPDGTYIFTITDACGESMVNVSYAYTPPTGNTRPLFPAFDAAINTGRPTVVSVNTCTDCDCRDASINSLDDDAVDLEWDPSYTVGQMPNVVEFSDFFGIDASGNEGTAGDISASGLPQGEDYALFTSVGICLASPTASCGGGDGQCALYTGGFEIDATTFSVGASTSTTADLHEFEIEIVELASKGPTTEISEDVGFYARVELAGDNFAEATIFIPNLGAQSLSFDGGNEFDWISAVQASHDDALAIFPLTDGESKYVLMVDNGRAATAVEFDPVQPNGKMSFIGLSDGDTISPTPTFDLTNTCTNCTLGVVWLEDFLTEGDVVDSEAEEENPAAGPISFVAPDDFDHSGPLAAEDYLVGSESLEEDFFDEGTPDVPLLVKTAGEDGFSYFALDATVDIIRVTVPEPALLAIQIASLACVAGLARRRRCVT